MLPPKPKSEVESINALISQITPYLQGEAEYTDFIRRRIDAQIDEVNDPYYYKAARFYFLFSIGENEEGARLAEEVIMERPSDFIAWGNYILCTLYTMGLEKAFELSVRAAEKTNSPKMVRDTIYYARGLGDYQAFEKYLAKYSLMGNPDFDLSDEDNSALPLAVEQAALAMNSGFADEISHVGKMMHSMIKPLQQIDAMSSFYLIEDEGEKSYVLEITPPGITPEECAELNIALVKKRAATLGTNWDVVGIFSNEVTKQRGL
ncbi:hypothetical protein CWS43_09715 [Rahnella sp. AA]|uniref:hypothetical protein n=1 Tax=Rahnella sp. AA TaxID=2057180 RepID=UPI000C3260BE|nr:hypothetical protein [Rahnella sp. AA]PKE30948.1 hypothetical protein CWS43_09715 [Rahnella sp. AA]